MALLIGPVVALLGLVCMYYVLRGRAKTRTSLYTARRTLLQARTAERRQRALGGAGAPVAAGSIPAVQQSPAPASAAAVADVAPTMVTPEAMPALPPEAAWEQSPTRPQPAAPPPPPPAPLEAQPAGPAPNQPEAWPPAPLPPPAPPPPVVPEPAIPAAAAPAAPVDWPSSTAQVEPPPAPPAEQVPIEPTMPAAEAPWEPAPPTEPPAFEPAAAVPAEAPPEPPPFVAPEPEPPAEPAKPAGAGWSIVGQGGEEISADQIGAEPARGTAKEEKKGKRDRGREEEERVPVGAASGAAWDVVPHARARHEELNLANVPDGPKESVGMTLLSYAGLVGALVVVLLGVLLMVATSR